MTVALESCSALVLNADYRPLNYFPLSLWSWQEVVKAVFLERVNIVAEYDREVHSPSWCMRLPSVISLKSYIKADHRPAFTRFNVFLRDGFSCQYCNRRQRSEELTFDHLVPRSAALPEAAEGTQTAAQGVHDEPLDLMDDLLRQPLVVESGCVGRQALHGGIAHRPRRPLSWVKGDAIARGRCVRRGLGPLLRPRSR